MRPWYVAVVTLAAVLVASGVFVLVAPHWSTELWWFLRATAYFWLPLAAVLVLGGLTLRLGGGPPRRRRPGPRTRVRPGPAALLGLLTLVAGALALWYVTSFHGYQKAREYHASTALRTDGVPALSERAPFQVAEAQARPNLGDVSGEIVDTSYLPDSGTFATVVARPGWLTGYQVALDQQVPLTGRGTGTTCQFDRERAVDRDGGWFGHNLARELHGERRWVSYDAQDLYAYCDGDAPVVVLPLKRQNGFFTVTQESAGVALYDGRTGELRIVDDEEGLAKVPGPTYPISLAARQRESLTAPGGYWDYRAGRTGYEDTSSDDADVNAGNNTEFALAVSAGKAPVYVTPLTGRGSATAIAAVSLVSGRQDGAGRNRLTAHRLNDPWVSTSAIAARVKADYQDLPNWQNLRLFEVAPTGTTTWVATLGNDQNVLYRVTGTGDLSGATPTCLTRADGTKVRCGSVADRAGNGPGTQFGPGQPGAGGVPGDLAGLSDAELAEVQRRVSEEVGRRLRGGR